MQERDEYGQFAEQRGRSSWREDDDDDRRSGRYSRYADDDDRRGRGRMSMPQRDEYGQFTGLGEGRSGWSRQDDDDEYRRSGRTGRYEYADDDRRGARAEVSGERPRDEHGQFTSARGGHSRSWDDDDDDDRRSSRYSHYEDDEDARSSRRRYPSYPW
jgi:hypothetical protein